MQKSLRRIYTRARVLSARLYPEIFWRAYSRNARALGYDRLYAVFSFDCDTDEDIPAALSIHRWLRERGQQAVFAVPGAQLQAGSATFKIMAGEGAEFINHGAAPHTEKRGNRYWSINFYDQLHPQQVEQDIVRGHEIFQEVLGLVPLGFRAPHFGHYQQPSQLQHLAAILQTLGYRYTSTSLPSVHKQPSPSHPLSGLVEFPVSGSYWAPLNVFDSYGHLAGYDQPHVRSDYADKLARSAQKLKDTGVGGIMNFYCDPAHVAGDAGYYQVLEFCLNQGIEFATFGQIYQRCANSKSESA